MAVCLCAVRNTTTFNIAPLVGAEKSSWGVPAGVAVPVPLSMVVYAPRPRQGRWPGRWELCLCQWLSLSSAVEVPRSVELCLCQGLSLSSAGEVAGSVRGYASVSGCLYPPQGRWPGRCGVVPLSVVVSILGRGGGRVGAGLCLCQWLSLFSVGGGGRVGGVVPLSGVVSILGRGGAPVGAGLCLCQGLSLSSVGEVAGSVRGCVSVSGCLYSR